MRTIDRVDKLCKKQDKTNVALSKYLGISQSTLSTWKTKENRDMDIKYLEKTAEFLETTVEYLVTGKEPSPLQPANEEEESVIEMLRSLPDRERYLFIGRLQEASENHRQPEEKRSLA